jgi:hypothetical protein
MLQKSITPNFPQEYEFPVERGLSDTSGNSSLQSSLPDLFARTHLIEAPVNARRLDWKTNGIPGSGDQPERVSVQF